MAVVVGLGDAPLGFDLRRGGPCLRCGCANRRPCVFGEDRFDEFGGCGDSAGDRGVDLGAVALGAVGGGAGQPSVGGGDRVEVVGALVEVVLCELTADGGDDGAVLVLLGIRCLVVVVLRGAHGGLVS